MMSKPMQSLSRANSGLGDTSAVSCYRQDSSLKARPSMGSRKENNMAISEPAKLVGRMSVREEVRKAQQERSERTRKVMEEWFKMGRMPDHLRPRPLVDLPTLEEWPKRDW